MHFSVEKIYRFHHIYSNSVDCLLPLVWVCACVCVCTCVYLSTYIDTLMSITHTLNEHYIIQVYNLNRKDSLQFLVIFFLGEERWDEG